MQDFNLNHTPYTNLKEFIKECAACKATIEWVEKYLHHHQVDEETKEKTLRLYRYELAFKTGMGMIAVGGALLLLAFGVPFFIEFEHLLFNLSLYGFTGTGSILAIYGLYKIIG